jgi:hypothetical protein
VVVVPDGSDEGEESLQDAYEDALRTVRRVVEAELHPVE